MDDSVAFRRTEPSGHTVTAGVLSKPGLELRIGSNIFRSTNGVVKIHGKEQLVLEVKPERGLLLATLDLYNEHGIRLAHLRRNVLMLNDNGRFTVDVLLGQGLSSVDSPSILVSYETPEIIATSVTQGSADYLQWLADSTGDAID